MSIECQTTQNYSMARVQEQKAAWTISREIESDDIWFEFNQNLINYYFNSSICCRCDTYSFTLNSLYGILKIEQKITNIMVYSQIDYIYLIILMSINCWNWKPLTNLIFVDV